MSDDALRRQVIEVLTETREQFDAGTVRLGGLLHRRMADALIAKGLIRPAPVRGMLAQRADGSTWFLGDTGEEYRVDTGPSAGAGGPTPTSTDTGAAR